ALLRRREERRGDRPGPRLYRGPPPSNRSPAHPAGAAPVFSRALTVATFHASPIGTPFASSACSTARKGSCQNASAGHRPITREEMFAAAAAHANASMAPATPATPNVDASGITTVRARPFTLNQSRASHLPSSSGDVAAPASNSDEKRGVAPDIC